MASLFPLSWTGWVSILSAAVAMGQASSLPVRSVDDIGRLEACPTAEEQAKTVAPLRIITLGDSITKGVRPGVAAAETFGALIEAELRKTARRVEVVNSGVGSERTDGALARLDRDVLAKQPDVVLIMYGTNDSYVDPGRTEPRLSREQFAANLREIVGRLSAVKIKPVLMTEPRWGDAAKDGVGENPNKRLESYMAACREVAKETNTPLVDHFALWSDAAARGADVAQWTTDQCHPNPAGNRVLAAAIVRTMRRDGLADLVQPTAVRTIVADGRHNAFTALARFRGELWLAFRSAKDHNSQDGDIVVLRSADDGRDWREATRLNAVPDDRDPQFLATDDRLFLYDAGMTGPELTTYATFTDDGATWSKPQAVYEPRFIVWKPCRHNGRFYAGAHKKDEVSGGKGREARLITSTDGLNWTTVSQIRAGNWESETTPFFAADHRATMFMRQKYGSPPCEVFEAVPPYATWTRRPAGVPHLSGHSVHTFRGVDYLLSRSMDYAKKQTGTIIYTFAHGELTPYCVLPSGGDCSYAEAVEQGDSMLVSYYSSHEGATNIYLATVPLASF
jgi:acyl-CoA thioesterase-1